jgi:hypothetical protein
LSAGLEEFP